METHKPLDAAAIAALQRELPAWQLRGASLVRECRFPDFAQAFAFMTRVAQAADALDHHPDWSNSYNRVSITLTSHDVGALTARDAELARRIDALLAQTG